MSSSSSSSSSIQYPCTHKCGCAYKSKRANDVKRHETTGASHRNCTPECPSHHLLTHDNIRIETPHSISAKQQELQKPQITQGRQKPQTTQEPTIRRTYQHPQIRSLIAKHCDQLSSGLVDIFRTEVEREVKQRVSEVILSEATACCEHLRSKDEALLAAETKCKDLQEQLELSDQTCRQLQEKVRQLEATEAELRIALNKGLEVPTGDAPLPLDNRHLAVVYEWRDDKVLCRLCIAGRSKDETLPVTSFNEDAKPFTLVWHIQHHHPQDYNLLLNMAGEELSEIAKEMSRVGA